jgi:hypothetical protein
MPNWSTLTAQLKRKLWECYGSASHPAEWDGRVYGGGKISQRFWEYFKTIEFLDLEPGAKLLDIGGASPAGGGTFFGDLVASCGVEVLVLDQHPGASPQITPLEGLADHDTLAEILKRREPTHISCISVLEHASPAQQSGIFQAIEDAFQGSRFVCTFEFHETTSYFEEQLTTASLSQIVSVLRRYYLSNVEAAPMHCVDTLRPIFPMAVPALPSACPVERLWYPLALAFTRA